MYVLYVCVCVYTNKVCESGFCVYVWAACALLQGLGVCEWLVLTAVCVLLDGQEIKPVLFRLLNLDYLTQCASNDTSHSLSLSLCLHSFFLSLHSRSPSPNSSANFLKLHYFPLFSAYSILPSSYCADWACQCLLECGWDPFSSVCGLKDSPLP